VAEQSRHRGGSVTREQLAIDRHLEPAEDADHHEDCPQHPWNAVFDEVEPCECEALREEDRIHAQAMRHARF
jgi:hypothetical protein